MSFGFNVRCCMVVESYIVYVFCTNIELFRDGHYLCRRRGWEKNWGGKAIFNQQRGELLLFSGTKISNGNRTLCRPIRSVIILVINKSDSRCAVVRFSYHSYDYRPNWTPLSPITITYLYLFFTLLYSSSVSQRRKSGLTGRRNKKKKSKHRTGQTLYKVFLVVGGFKVRNDGA